MTNPLPAARPTEPTERDAADIATEVIGACAEAVTRFPTGSGHYVYDVRLAGGLRAVVRIARREDIEAARGAVYWSQLLRPKGVPLPALLHADLSMTRHPFPVVVLERLPATISASSTISFHAMHCGGWRNGSRPSKPRSRSCRPAAASAMP